MSNKPHIISLPELQEWMETNEALYASAQGSGENKRLTVTMSGGFKLYHNRQVVWEGTQPFTAVEKYNNL